MYNNGKMTAGFRKSNNYTWHGPLRELQKNLSTLPCF